MAAVETSGLEEVKMESETVLTIEMRGHVSNLWNIDFN